MSGKKGKRESEGESNEIAIKHKEAREATASVRDADAADSSEQSSSD